MTNNEPATHTCRCTAPHWQLGTVNRCLICGGDHYKPDKLPPPPPKPHRAGERIHCSRCGTSVSSPVSVGTVVRAWVECPECIEKQPDFEKQRDAWRAACRFLYEVIGEGGAKGRPLDLIAKGDYGRIIAMIGKAEALENEDE